MTQTHDLGCVHCVEEHLSLEYIALTGTIPSEIFSMTNLGTCNGGTLAFSDCLIKCVFFFTADELGLDGNRLTGTIATEFGHLERLSTSCGGGGGTAMRPFANLDS